MELWKHRIGQCSQRLLTHVSFVVSTTINSFILEPVFIRVVVGKIIEFIKNKWYRISATSSARER